MTSLIERIEAATGPDWELDAEIAALLGWKKLPNPGSMGGLIDMWINPSGKNERWNVPPYTSSIDAALTLLPGDAMWRLGHDGKGPDPSEFLCEIVSGPECRNYCAIAPTAALALCAAALRARGVM